MNPALVKKISSIPNWKAANGTNLINAINQMKGVPVKDVKYSDLLLPAWCCNGIYVFQQGSNYRIVESDSESSSHQPPYWYVGKASSCAVVERIGSHHSPHQNSFMNNLLKSIAWLLSGCPTLSDFTDGTSLSPAAKNNLIEKAFPVFEDLILKVIVFDVPYSGQTLLKNDISQAEKWAINNLNPFLNNVNRKQKQLSLFPIIKTK